VNPNLGQPVKNKYDVQKKQWAKWSNHSRRVFNDMYYALRPSMQFTFMHPSAAAMPKEHWDTLRWNVAWTAADIVNDKKRTHRDRSPRHGK
jgi:oxalate decarboxylase/phosphoglucose isomerase-like protein (cupin superfamily)